MQTVPMFLRSPGQTFCYASSLSSCGSLTTPPIQLSIPTLTVPMTGLFLFYSKNNFSRSFYPCQGSQGSFRNEIGPLNFSKGPLKISKVVKKKYLNPFLKAKPVFIDQSMSSRRWTLRRNATREVIPINDFIYANEQGKPFRLIILYANEQGKLFR